MELCMTPDLSAELDTPQALIDLDVVDRNVSAMRALGRDRGVDVWVHFKSLKCGGLAKYLMAAGFDMFLCAKLCEAEVLIDAQLKDVLVANQVVGPLKTRRLAAFARRASVSVDDPGNVDELAAAAKEYWCGTVAAIFSPPRPSRCDGATRRRPSDPHARVGYAGNAMAATKNALRYGQLAASGRDTEALGKKSRASVS
jgi:hypothetical protein